MRRFQNSIYLIIKYCYPNSLALLRTGCSCVIALAEQTDNIFPTSNGGKVSVGTYFIWLFKDNCDSTLYFIFWCSVMSDKVFSYRKNPASKIEWEFVLVSSGGAWGASGLCTGSTYVCFIYILFFLGVLQYCGYHLCTDDTQLLVCSAIILCMK